VSTNLRQLRVPLDASVPVRKARVRRTAGQRVGHAAVVALAWLLAVAFVFPYLFMVLSAFKSPLDVFAYPPRFVFAPTLDSVRSVFETYDLGSYLTNSAIVATGATFVALALGVPAAYALERMALRHGELIAYLMLAMQLLPSIAVVFGMFAVGDALNLIDTPWILIIGYSLWNVPYTIWLTRGFIAGVPVELEEAAMVDGASRRWTLLHVVVPLCAPGLLAAGILIFISAWNEFTLAFFLTSTRAHTYPTSIGLFLTHAGVQWGPMFATAAIGTLPVVLAALIVRRYFVSALTLGAVKG
jgi:ABC-type glycerol-3-phosphate transport system permease component